MDTFIRIKKKNFITFTWQFLTNFQLYVVSGDLFFNILSFKVLYRVYFNNNSNNKVVQFHFKVVSLLKLTLYVHKQFLLVFAIAYKDFKLGFFYGQ